MMQAGLCSVSFRSLTVDQIIALAKANGMDCIEWGGDLHVPVGDLQTAADVAKRSAAAGLQIHSYGSYYHCRPDEAFEPIAQTAHALGAKIVRIWAGDSNSEEFAPLAFQALCQTVCQAAEIAEQYGLTLAFEHHHGTYCNTAQSSLHLLQAIRRSNVKTYWQPAYWRSENSLELDLQAIRLLQKEIVGVHVYQWKNTERLPLEAGKSDWKQYLAILGENRYYLEFIRDDSTDQLQRDFQALRSLLK